MKNDEIDNWKEFSEMVGEDNNPYWSNKNMEETVRKFLKIIDLFDEHLIDDCIIFKDRMSSIGSVYQMGKTTELFLEEALHLIACARNILLRATEEERALIEEKKEKKDEL